METCYQSIVCPFKGPSGWEGNSIFEDFAHGIFLSVSVLRHSERRGQGSTVPKQCVREIRVTLYSLSLYPKLSILSETGESQILNDSSLSFPRNSHIETSDQSFGCIF